MYYIWKERESFRYIPDLVLVFTGVITLPHFLFVLVLLKREPRCYHIAMLAIGGVSDVA